MPLHTWLPDAHVEAPTAGSVILAGVLLKMGTYGFMKLAFPLFPDATRLLAPVFGTLAVVSILYGACLALVQTDIKKIIAYSSISHLGYVMLGLVSLDLLGIQGAVMQMVSHGLVAGGLFLIVGMIYERCHTRELAAYGGLAKLLPVYSVFFALLTLAAIGLPTTSGFTGEFLVLLGAFRAAWPQYVQGAAYPLIVSASAVAGIVLGALYMLWFAQRFLFGAAKAPHLPLVDLNLREKAILVPIVIAVFALGCFPMRRCANGAGGTAIQRWSPARGRVPGREAPEFHRRRPNRDSAAKLQASAGTHELLDSALPCCEHFCGRNRDPHRGRDRCAVGKRHPAVVAARRNIRCGGRGLAVLEWIRLRRVRWSLLRGPSALLAKAIVLALAVPCAHRRDDYEQGAFPSCFVLAVRRLPVLSAAASSRCSLDSSSCRFPVPLVLLAFRRPPKRRAALNTWFWAAPLPATR